MLVNEFGGAKLADFGCSKRLGAEGTLGEESHGPIKGTPYFMAPGLFSRPPLARPSH